MTTPLSMPRADAAGTFLIGGSLQVARLGFGAMRITGPGVWGEPDDRDEALRVLRRLPELGVNFIDTADSYGPEVSETLIRQALHPYDGLVVATKGGFERSGPDAWQVNGRPEYLIRQAKRSREILGMERIPLWQLHRVDSAVPRDEQFAAIRELINEGVIEHAGLSEVTVDDIKAAQRFFPVATVQNRYNLFDRGSEDVLIYSEQNNIGFIPWYPLGAGALTDSSDLDRIAARSGITRGQLALSWLLRRSPVMLPIPGTSKQRHLEENVQAASIRMSDADWSELDAR
ncbi:MAG: aldo/keto reductase [Lysobacter sp.]